MASVARFKSMLLLVDVLSMSSRLVCLVVSLELLLLRLSVGREARKKIGRIVYSGGSLIERSKRVIEGYQRVHGGRCSSSLYLLLGSSQLGYCDKLLLRLV